MDTCLQERTAIPPGNRNEFIITRVSNSRKIIWHVGRHVLYLSAIAGTENMGNCGEIRWKSGESLVVIPILLIRDV